MKYAKCIKAGRLEDGELFCRKGDIYPYEIDEYGQWPIHMENLCSKDHKMGRAFFDRYFVSITDEIFLEERDFEI